MTHGRKTQQKQADESPLKSQKSQKSAPYPAPQAEMAPTTRSLAPNINFSHILTGSDLKTDIRSCGAVMPRRCSTTYRMEAAYGTINEASPAAAQPQPGPAQAVTPHHLPRIVRLNRHPVQAPG